MKYNKIETFKYVTNKILPSVYDDSLSYSELLAKVIAYLNATITNVDEFKNFIDDFVEKYDAKIYGTLTVILYEMIEKGEFSPFLEEQMTKIKDIEKIVNDYKVMTDNKLNSFNNTLSNNKIDKTGVEQITYVNLSQEVKEKFTGGAVAVVGVNSVSTSNVVNKSITSDKLDDNYKAGEIIPIGSDLINVISSKMMTGQADGGYIGLPLNVKPSAIFGFTNYPLYENGKRWFIQYLIEFTYPHTQYCRLIDYVNKKPNEWVKIGENETTTRAKYPYLDSNNSINELVTEGKWIAINAKDQPISGNVQINNTTYRTVEPTFSNTSPMQYWGNQIVTPLDGTPEIWYRRFDSRVVEGKQEFRFFEWTRILTQEDIGRINYAPLRGKLILNLGDSIFGNTRNSTSVSSYIEKHSGGTCINSGFGGSRVAVHSPNWVAFSLYKLVDELIKDDTDTTKWNLQDQAITAMKNGTVNGMPGYFEEALNTLKAVDMNSVNYLTIAHGTNDYTGNTLVDNETDIYDTTTFGGALRYSLEKLMTKFKHLNILLCTPMYRFWLDESLNFIEDSDTKEFKGQLLKDFVNKEIEISKSI